MQRIKDYIIEHEPFGKVGLIGIFAAGIFEDNLPVAAVVASASFLLLEIQYHMEY
ncbi:MAG TPA: hypothetical protein PLU75_06065 [Oscillospiraceae bacterium]|nr:hypothetical protein [Oscillospiraceae bacterium]HRW57813.1 hypothetical protein [Oscillospiraceae bacterium]